MNMKEIAKPALILFLITGVVAALLGGVNLLTVDKIEQNNLVKEKQALSQVMKDAEFEPLAKEAAQQYQVGAIYEAKIDGQPAGYCIKLAKNGYGGPITVVVGVSPGQKITGVRVITQTETPGLGANATSNQFLDQYNGKSKIGVVKSGPKENDIVALSGATITSKAVTDAVNRAVEVAGELKGGGAK